MTHPFSFDLPSGLGLEEPIGRALAALGSMPRAMPRDEAAAHLDLAARRWRDASAFLQAAAEQLRAEAHPAPAQAPRKRR